jgi:hypothetical protein
VGVVSVGRSIQIVRFVPPGRSLRCFGFSEDSTRKLVSDISISPRTHIRIENLAVMDFAGDAAEKKFNPRRRFGGYKEMHYAVDLHTYISGSEEILAEPIAH